MDNKIDSKFNINWVLFNKLAISRYPKTQEEVNLIKKLGIKNILQLCSEDEFECVTDIKKYFNHSIFFLPDHRSPKELKKYDLKKTLEILTNFIMQGPTLVHCLAGKERSPLVCLTYLVKEEKINFDSALEYISEVNPGSCPIKSHLQLVRNLK